MKQVFYNTYIDVQKKFDDSIFIQPYNRNRLDPALK